MPPDKSEEEFLKEETKDHESEIVDSEIMDVVQFEKRLLTKPSNLSTRQTVNNMKMVVQGKYLLLNNQSATTKRLKRDGSSSRDDSEITATVKESPCEVPLPPRHENKPVNKPTATPPSIDIAKNIERLLKIEDHFVDPIFKFEVSEEAAAFNYKLLKSNNLDLDLLLNQGEKSITSYGSEFKDSDQLEDLLKMHPI